MTLVITINLILAAVVLVAVVGPLAAAIRPSRRIATPARASSQTASFNRTSRQAQRPSAGGPA